MTSKTLLGQSFPVGFTWATGNRCRSTRALEEAAARVLESFGFEEIQTPLVLPGHLILGMLLEPDREGEVFILPSSNGEPNVLRFENTNPIAWYVGHTPDRVWPARYYYICPMLRNEPHTKLLQEGSIRFKQFVQCGWENMGYVGMAAVAESIQAGLAIMGAAGHEGCCVVGHNALLEYIYESLDLGSDLRNAVHNVLQEIRDPIDARDALEMLKFSNRTMHSLLALYGLRGDPASVLAAARTQLPPVPGVKQCLDEMEQLIEATEALESRSFLRFDLSLARYRRLYDGVVFRFDTALCPECGAGGEARRLLLRHGGVDKPLVGGGLGIERLLVGFALDDQPRSEYVIWGRNAIQMLQEAALLRKSGARVESATNCSSLKAAEHLAREIGAKLHVV